MLPSGFVMPETLAGFGAGEPVLLGLSGGADSSSLLHMLVSAGVKVHACHVHHGIRGTEADRDLEFCRNIAENYKIPFYAGYADVPAAAAESGEGLEEAARRLRYGILTSYMKNEGIRILVTAHNADDNAETVIFNLARGASAKGGCGIPPVRPLGDGLTVVRPLLRVSRAEIEEYCRTNSLEYVTDSTNADTAYSRNRIRHNIIPELKAINPDAVGAFARFSCALAEDNAYLDGLAEDFIRDNPVPGLKAAAELPVPVLRRALTLLARNAGARPEASHIEELCRYVLAGKNCGIAMPGSVIARISKKKITFTFDPRIKKIKPCAAQAEAAPKGRKDDAQHE